VSAVATLRRGLFGLTALACLGTAAELALVEHMESPVQLVPFALCAVGLGGAVLGMLRPDARTPLLAIAGLLALGGLFGVWEHLEHNYAFDVEIRPTADAATHVWHAITGANPLLAPGGLSLAGAALALGAWPLRP